MTQTPPPKPADRRGVWLGAAGLLLLLGLAYHNSFRGPFVFDDLPAIVHNESIRALWPLTRVLAPELGDGGVTVSGRPLVNLSLALNYALGGESVTGYHAVNLLIHAAAALVLFGVVRRSLLLPALAPRWSSVALPAGLSVAALWALHPLQTAAVTYIVQRAEALMGLCFLVALYAFIRATEKPETGNLKPEEGRLAWLTLSVAACLAGMACKEVMVMAPLMIFLYDRTLVAGTFRRAWQVRWKCYLPLAATWLLLAWLVAGTGGRGRTAGFGVEVSPWTYALTQGEAIIHYLRLTLWPQPLVFDYGTATVAGFGAVWWQVAVIVFLLVAVAYALVRRPVIGLVGAWFFGLLAPSSSFVPVATQTMAEHRMYLALLAPVMLIVIGLHRLLGSRAGIAAAGLAVIWAGVTYARNFDYATAQGLWADTLAKRPANVRAHHNLGLAELAAGRLPEAEQHLRRAVALDPAAPEPHYNLGVVLARAGRPREGMAAYREVLRLEPAHGASRRNLGDLLMESGRPAEALAEFEAAIRAQPGVGEFHFSAGNAAAALGRFEAAAAYYREAVRLRPDYAEAHNNLGNSLLELDRLPEALEEFETALRHQPDYFEPRRTLALLLLLHLNRPAEARTHLEILARARPGDREIADALARARQLTR
ncbi:tetratricopeptide repeat protein [Oleiharenicola lentus]|uniref:Tetratricopeptide repeat protein n=1 Tax=Oleiharenicola lentus TaxID=2508720 RepID=A0A4Q1C8T5_9BACT|nr:tetratricopeptide repeat protein [Oleiharenicola lentus]RXK55364.1 tetratricopeptide repeat protein [Oleiharenicola lentus]